MLKRVIACDFVPEGHDAGLLVLRVIAGGSLLLKHGLEKVEHFAMIGDFVCSILIILGLGTRWAAAWSFLNILAAWAFVHHFLFFGRGSDHGELIVLYLAAMLVLVLAGPGRYSVDAALK